MTNLLTIEEAAEEIGVKPRAVRWWIESGELEFVPIGRRIYIDLADYEAMVARLKTRKAKKAKNESQEDMNEIELE